MSHELIFYHYQREPYCESIKISLITSHGQSCVSSDGIKYSVTLSV